MLEMIANCNWTRPLYVAITVGSENFMNLGDNFVQEGLVNRITPFSTVQSQDQKVSTCVIRYREDIRCNDEPL